MFVEDVNASELPHSWEYLPLGEVSILSAGGDRPDICQDYPSSNCIVPIYSNGIDNEGLYGYTNKAKIFDESVTVSARGTVGFVCLRGIPYVPIVRLISVIPKCERISAKYLYFALSTGETHSTGTSQQQITVPDFKTRPILVPTEQDMNLFLQRVEPMFSSIRQNKDEIKKLTLLQANVLATLSR